MRLRPLPLRARGLRVAATRALSVLVAAVALATLLVGAAVAGEHGGSSGVLGQVASAAGGGRGCPAEMVRVHDYCVDRWEISTVDAETGAALSPYYPPDAKQLRLVHRVWQVERTRVGDAGARRMPLPPVPAVQQSEHFEPKAISAAGAVPQGYLSYYTAHRACANAEKRLCTEEEWVTACKGARQLRYPYGGDFLRSQCNVYRYYHPAHILHGATFVGHGDPRLNLVVERGVDPVLRPAGATPSCASAWGRDAAYDMVGNLDEWVADPQGVFVGGFYARAATTGCDARIASHSPLYYDYSLGTRCCKAAE